MNDILKKHFSDEIILNREEFEKAGNSLDRTIISNNSKRLRNLEAIVNHIDDIQERLENVKGCILMGEVIDVAFNNPFKMSAHILEEIEELLKANRESEGFNKGLYFSRSLLEAKKS
jgi:hypothetical protein